VLHRSKSHAIGAGAGAFALLLAGLTLSDVGRAQSPASEKELFEKRCSACHLLEGPQLHSVYGRKAGTVESFQYSDALKKSNIVWTEETLECWLTDTDKLVPDNDVTLHVEKREERRAIVVYLRRESRKSSDASRAAKTAPEA
jgi:cytochrome c